MQAVQPENITTDSILLPEMAGKHIQLDVLRLDKIHPVISGNKWFKLKYYLEDAITQGKKHIITFGGAWSNHIVAATAACKMYGLQCTGIIRGEEPAVYSATLNEARLYGMQLHFRSRQDYAQKIIPPALLTANSFIIPEGGYGAAGAKGAAGIPDYCNKQFYTHICCAAGTGTMAAGLIDAAEDNQQVLVFSVLKNNHELVSSLQSLLTTQKEFFINDSYHFGGYAKHTPHLITFMNHFFQHTGIPLDFVYTAKLMAGVIAEVEKGMFPAGSRILAIHSGGLQGNASLPKGTLIF